MKTTLKIALITVACSLFTVSCDTIIDLEDLPPTKGKVTLIIDWTNRTEGIPIPAAYTAIFNNKTLTFNDNTNVLPELEAGTYPLLMYNMADKVTLSGTTATIKTENNIVDPVPGWLFTYVGNISYEAGEEKTVTATMQQQVRQLTITIKPEGSTAGKLASIDAILNGVAAAWNIQTNKPEGNPCRVIPSFAKQADGTWQATVRLLGTTGSEQKLAVTLNFPDGIEPITIDSNLNTELSGFNQDKDKPLTLSAKIVETHTELGLTTEIEGWTVGDGESGNAE